MLARDVSAIPDYRPQFHSRCRFLLCSTLCLAVIACGDDTPTEVEELESETENPCTAAVAISIGETANGSLQSSDCVQPDGAYSDRFSLSLSSHTDVRIDLRSNAFDAFLELRDNLGNVLAINDDAGGSLNSRIIQPLDAGSYIILARSLGPEQSGSYSLSVSLGPDCSPIGDLTLGETVTGTLASDDCLFEYGGLMDNWSLSLTSTQKLRIDLKSSDFDEILLLRDSQGLIINGADWGGPTGHARLETELPAGDWTISVSTPSETVQGAYTLTVDVAPPCTPGTDFVIGTTVNGEITASDCLLDGYLPADSFGLEITQEMPVGIHLKSADFSPLVILRDQNGMDVGVGYDETQDGNAFINMSLGQGSYSLFATTVSYPPQGSYVLSVSEIVCDAADTISFGETVSGTLDASDCLRTGGAFQESWQLVLDNDTTARIDLESAAFDAFLVLKDSQGNIVASDDDGGDGLNARIERVLEAGTYEIVASSFAANQTGAYQLTVGAPPAAAAARVDGMSETRPKAAADSESATELLARFRAAYMARLRTWLGGHGPKMPPF
jgi:hypothetical protein